MGTRNQNRANEAHVSKWDIFLVIEHFLKFILKLFIYFYLAALSGMWDLSSPTRDQTVAHLTLEVWSTNHWTTREVPKWDFFTVCFLYTFLEPGGCISEKSNKTHCFKMSQWGNYLVVQWLETLHSHCQGPRLSPWLGIKIPQAAQCGQINKMGQ